MQRQRDVGPRPATRTPLSLLVTACLSQHTIRYPRWLPRVLLVTPSCGLACTTVMVGCKRTALGRWVGGACRVGLRSALRPVPVALLAASFDGPCGALC